MAVRLIRRRVQLDCSNTGAKPVSSLDSDHRAQHQGQCRPGVVSVGRRLVLEGVRISQRYVRDVKIAAVLRLLKADGWMLVAQRGSHRQLKHPEKPGRVTVAGKLSDDLAPGTLLSIMKQAGLGGRRG